MSRSGVKRHLEEIDFELNLAPIIDCFVVLITYLLVSAAFLSIGMFDVNIGAGESVKTDTKPPAISVYVELDTSKQIKVRVTGKENRSFAIEPKEGSWDFEGAKEQLKALQAKYPEVVGATFSADNTTEWQGIVKGIESVREAFPSVTMGE
jgi:biopolymer transport protein ExbD